VAKHSKRYTIIDQTLTIHNRRDLIIEIDA